jgi:HlyD family secretion protein
MRQRLMRAAVDPEGQVGLALAGVSVLTVCWFCFWRVPTEVVGRGVLIVPGGATVVDARAPGQILRIPVRVGERVRRGQPLMELYLPILDQELRRQERDLRELILLNDDLNRRDGLRLASAQRVRDTTLAKLAKDLERYRGLRATYDQKVSDFRYLASQEVVAPLAQEVVSTEDRAIQLDVSAAELKVREKEASEAYQKVKLELDTSQLQRRFRIDELRRSIAVTSTRLRFEGTLLAEREGQILDIQVVRGQTVKAGQRLGTLGEPMTDGLQAVAYFAPADARRLPEGLPVEVVPDWNERARFGGMLGEVDRVSLLPATREDVNTTMGNPQLAESLVKDGPVMRAEISLRRKPSNGDGYRWTMSKGSTVFPIREGLTLKAHGYVEWRTPLSYVVPALRDLTGSYRNLRQERQSTPQLRQQ